MTSKKTSRLARLTSLLALFFLPAQSTAGSSSSSVKEEEYKPARVPYVFPSSGSNSVADDFRARRANGTLLALDGVLLNAPLVAEGWNNLATAIRNNNTLPGSMRELVILRIAVLNSAAYEWEQHESVGRAEGLTSEQLRAIRRLPSLAQGNEASENLRAQAQEVLGPQLTAALEFTDWNTQTIRVPKEVFEATKQALGGDNGKIVELAATCGMYNLVSRFLISLDVDGQQDVPVPIPA